MRLLAVALLVLGVLAIIYGGFWYTKEDTKAEVGPIKVKVEERTRLNVPLWAGVAAVGAGAILLATGSRRAA